MKREKKICFCFTPPRIVGAILLATSLVNLIIAGAVVEAASTDAPTATPSLPSPGQEAEQSLNVTATMNVPTATALETFTPASTSTETASPTPSPTFTETATATTTLTATFTSSPTPTLCAPKSYWPSLYIQRGDTLYALALATGSTVNELMQANCLTDTRIQTGKLLYVPRLPIPTDTPTATVTPTETSVPTVFLNPSGNISLCSSLPYVYFSVLPIDQQDLKSVTVRYTINGNSWTTPMQPDGETYYASATLSAENSKIDFAYYSFSAVDGSGNFAYSVEYKFDFPACPQG